VARLALPNLRDPENISVNRILSDDEAEAARDGMRIIASHEFDQFLATPRCGGQFYDKSVQGETSKRE
jgi:hypothetical protein